MKNILCIYVIYDVQSVVNPYVGEVIKELAKFAGDICIICNFSKIAEGEQYIKSYTRKVYFRNNKGFDSGAYKDAILDFIGRETLEKYDELILTNDTYFAPIYPFDDMFKTMEMNECDWWGITRHPGGFNAELGIFESHIQSYFIVFGKKVLCSDDFYGFWEGFEYASNKGEAVQRFELGINRYLKSKGFSGLAYSDVTCQPVDALNGENPYMVLSLELIAVHKIPVIKKTNFYGKNPYLIKALRALDYIDYNTSYNTALIKDYINEYQHKGLIGSYYEFERMEDFVYKHDRIFIYGSGVWGRITADYLDYKRINFEGFIVTEKKCDGEVAFRDTDIRNTDGIIIAQEYKDVCMKIKEYINDRVNDDQIFIPCYP